MDTTENMANMVKKPPSFYLIKICLQNAYYFMESLLHFIERMVYFSFAAAGGSGGCGQTVAQDECADVRAPDEG
jgi:hypothetical protein